MLLFKNYLKAVFCFTYSNADNLSRRQLLANAEIRLTNNVATGIEALDADHPVDQDSSIDFVVPIVDSSILCAEKKWMVKRRKKFQNRNYKPRWIKGADFDTQEPATFLAPDFSRFKEMSMIDIFEEFIDEEIIQHFVVETRKYAHFLNCPDPKISANEIRCFIAILFLSGYNHLPSKRHFWDAGEDMKNMAVSQAMRRDRFLQICRFIHCTDNTNINTNDKAWKIRPVMEMLKLRCISNFVPERELAYDESMVKYFGRHGCKQFIRGRPIRFGYKIWSLNTKDGYLVNFELYQGKGPKSNAEYDSFFGKAASPLLVLLDEIPDEKRNLNYNLYMDNLFSGAALFSFLRFRGYSAVGTIRENRIPKNCPLLNKKAFGKKDRGYFETAMERNDGHLYVRWMDNAVVTMLSTSCGVEKVSHVKRFSQKHKRNIMIPRPHVIANYNTFMGGTDQMDQNLGCYRIGVRGKKWYWPLLTWMMDVACQNSWILYNKSGRPKISQLSFKRELVNVYLKKYGVIPKASGRPFSSPGSHSRVPDAIRYDHTDHLIKRANENKKIRCSGDSCKSIMRTKCTKCNVGLCVDCFVPFHSL